MADDQKEYQDYLDYVAYQKHIGGVKEPSFQETAANKIQEGLGKLIGSDYASKARNVAEALNAGAGGVAKGATLGNYEPGGVYEKSMKEHPYASAAGQIAGNVGAGVGLGSILGSVLPAGAGLKAGAARVGGNIAGLLGQKALEAPQEGETRLGNVAGAAKSPWTYLVPLGAEAIAQKALPMANTQMEKAAGIKKSVAPDMGNRLVSQNVWGTPSMMKSQVAEKLPEAENIVQDTVKSISGKVNGDDIANAIEKKAQLFINPDTGSAYAGKQPLVDQIREYAQAIRQQGSQSPSAALGGKRASDWVSRNASGNVGASLDAELNAMNANELRNKLYDMSKNAATPAKEALSNERALILANAGLKKPGTNYKSMLGLQDIGVGMMAPHEAGPGGKLGMILASKAAASPLFQSTAAHLLQRGVKPAADALSSPEVMQGLGLLFPK